MTESTESARPRMPWRIADVIDLIAETPRVTTLVLDVPGWPGHLAGQHVDVRLTGEDGYQAQRSYSIASAPDVARLSLTVERLEDGEVSPYLATDVRPGDRFELRGPIGYHFVWRAEDGGPLLLIAGGSGVVPLMAMLRHRAAAGSTVPATLVYSSRTIDDIIYRAELDRLAAASDTLTIVHTLTRQQPAAWTGGAGRIDRALLERVGISPSSRPRVFVCGSNGFVETATRTLLELGHEARGIKTERFGPTGG